MKPLFMEKREEVKLPKPSVEAGCLKILHVVTIDIYESVCNLLHDCPSGRMMNAAFDKLEYVILPLCRHNRLEQSGCVLSFVALHKYTASRTGMLNHFGVELPPGFVFG